MRRYAGTHRFANGFYSWRIAEKLAHVLSIVRGCQTRARSGIIYCASLRWEPGLVRSVGDAKYTPDCGRERERESWME